MKNQFMYRKWVNGKEYWRLHGTSHWLNVALAREMYEDIRYIVVDLPGYKRTTQKEVCHA